MAAIVLLPVLGVTWIIGIMAVNDNDNEVFRWIFAVSNCLQVNSITQQYSVWPYCSFIGNLYFYILHAGKQTGELFYVIRLVNIAV